jgi:hypothetical protein
MAMSESRVNMISLVFGTRGTGKTTYFKGDEKLKLEGIIDLYIDRDPKQKILIVDLFDSPVWKDIPLITIEKLTRWKSGIYRIFHRDIEMLFKILDQHCYNTVIIFEDATKYIKKKLPESLNDLLIDSKQKNNDVFFAFHYLMAAHPDLVRISDYVVFFKTNETFTNSYKNKYPHPAIEKAFLNVHHHTDFHYNESVKLI